jgi:hypothetical protein
VAADEEIQPLPLAIALAALVVGACLHLRFVLKRPAPPRGGQ